jgi:hypothetical protein
LALSPSERTEYAPCLLAHGPFQGEASRQEMYEVIPSAKAVNQFG